MTGGRSERGTTLSEVLIVLALTAVVATPIYLVMQSAFRTEQSQSRQLETEAQLERVAVTLEDDIREGSPSEKRAGAPVDELAIWHTDRNGDPSLILWSIDGDQLRRQVYDLDTGSFESDVVLLESVATPSPIFRYWRADGTELTPDADLVYRCSVRVSVDLQVDTGGTEAARLIDVTHREPGEADRC